MRFALLLAVAHHPQPHPNALIAVRFDDAAPQYCRALVTGPKGTPYFGGAFVFDVFFPPAYPFVPPLVQLVTTGHGQCRFNPNLVRDSVFDYNPFRGAHFVSLEAASLFVPFLFFLNIFSTRALCFFLCF